MRTCGILLPIASLPSKYGIGAFSRSAYEFVDFLAAAGQKVWQILPLGATGYGDSPYQSFSSYAGNPYFISLDDLVEKGWLTREECEACDFGDNLRYVDYQKIYVTRFKILEKAFLRSSIGDKWEYQQFLADNQEWLPDYALYMAVKNHFGGVSWTEWNEDIRNREQEAIAKYQEELASEISFYCFLQFEFNRQWLALKAYANERGIQIVGDIPIYVAFDSADTWADPKLFQFDEKNQPKAVAGCPPDGFSATGQLWGNPLYDWDYHRETGYDWWVKRMKHCFTLYDIVRVDHFRGFDEYYAIPYGNTTAEIGGWEKGPGFELFRVLKEKLGELKIIAEDLGYLTPSVLELVKKTGYPGMKVLQFAFDSGTENTYLPHHYHSNCVVYTGTHDNQTSKGWYDELPSGKRHFVNEYMDLTGREDRACWALIRAALASVADTAIIPVQDYLGLGAEARINEPSTLGDNWHWRLFKGELTEELAVEIKRLTGLYGRL